MSTSLQPVQAEAAAGCARPDAAATAATAAAPRRRWVGLAFVAAVVAALAAVLANGLGTNPTIVPSSLVGKPAPPLVGTTLDGRRLDLRDYRGSWVLVNTWASWCAACKAEHPMLLAAAQQLADRNLRIVGIDMSDDPAKARAWLKEMGGAYGPSVVDRNARIAATWGVFAVPETYLVSPSGRVVAKSTGVVTERWIRAVVLPRLPG